jgi:OOP family OmpA-OmpF porin
LLGAPASASAEAKGLELVGVGTIPFTQQLAAYGKAGVFRWDVDSRATAGAAAAGTGDKGTDFTFGVGLKYDFTRNLAGRLEFQRYNNVGETNTTGQSDVNLWTVGVMFKF